MSTQTGPEGIDAECVAILREAGGDPTIEAFNELALGFYARKYPGEGRVFTGPLETVETVRSFWGVDEHNQILRGTTPIEVEAPSDVFGVFVRGAVNAAAPDIAA